jgi:hypothetical protein
MSLPIHGGEKCEQKNTTKKERFLCRDIKCTAIGRDRSESGKNVEGEREPSEIIAVDVVKQSH